MHPIQSEMMFQAVQVDRFRDAAGARRSRRRRTPTQHSGAVRAFAGRRLIGAGNGLRRVGCRLTGATA
jgi:hypothetical protein